MTIFFFSAQTETISHDNQDNPCDRALAFMIEQMISAGALWEQYTQSDYR